jgi:hypothetical protein
MFVHRRPTQLQRRNALHQQLSRAVLKQQQNVWLDIVQNSPQAVDVGLEQEEFGPEALGSLVVVVLQEVSTGSARSCSWSKIYETEQGAVQFDDFGLEDGGARLLGQW